MQVKEETDNLADLLEDMVQDAVAVIPDDSSVEIQEANKSSSAEVFEKLIDKMNTPLGGCILADTPITFNENKPVTKVKVRNTGDRPIQVGSHFHFFEVKPCTGVWPCCGLWQETQYLLNNRNSFWTRWWNRSSADPTFGGKQTLYGFNNLVDGWTGEGVVPNSERPDKLEAIRRAAERGFKSSKWHLYNIEIHIRVISDAQ